MGINLKELTNQLSLRSNTYHFYGMKARGCSPGAQPKEMCARLDDPTGKYFDIIVYPNRYKLSDYALQHYDLDYLGSEVKA